MAPKQRMRIANEKATKNITLRGNVPKSSVSSLRWIAPCDFSGLLKRSLAVLEIWSVLEKSCGLPPQNPSFLRENLYLGSAFGRRLRKWHMDEGWRLMYRIWDKSRQFNSPVREDILCNCQSEVIDVYFWQITIKLRWTFVFSFANHRNLLFHRLSNVSRRTIYLMAKESCICQQTVSAICELRMWNSWWNSYIRCMKH